MEPIVKQYDGQIKYMVHLPHLYAPGTGTRPVICFLHGAREGAPRPILEALALHGPLRTGSSRQATDRFIVVAPQLPAPGGDVWLEYADAVQQIVLKVQEEYEGNLQQTYLTGFSFGGNGVFDIALAQHGLWAALWTVDPTRIPNGNPHRPVWFSLGQKSRDNLKKFQQVLGVQLATSNPNGDFLYIDRGKDHVGTATYAYQDDQVYAWLLTKHL